MRFPPSEAGHFPSAPLSQPFLHGGGEMGALMRAHRWSESPLGPPENWPQALRTVVRLMLTSGHPIYICWGPELACLYNDAYRESIGPELHPGSLGRPAREVWSEIWDVIGPQIEQVMAGRGATWHVDQSIPITRHGKREQVYWTYSYSPIDDDTARGGIGGVLVICAETTQQVLAVQALATERDQFAQMFEQAPSFMALLRGPEHRFERANPGYVELVEREVVGKTVAEALPEVVAQGYVALLDEVFKTGRPHVARGAKFAMRARDGASMVDRFVDFVYQPLKDASGQVTGIFVEGADVSERVRTDKALRESEASFRSALRAGQLGSWQTDRVTMTRQWSQEGMELFGLKLPGGRGQVGGSNDEYVAAIHPDDRHLALQLHHLADQQDSFPAEYRIVRPDGTTLWLSGRGLVVSRGPDGRAQRLVSIMADATERKQAENELRVERERLTLALTAGLMGAYELDFKTDFLWWSMQTYALFGVDPDAFVPSRQSVPMLIHPEDRDAFMEGRAKAIAEHRLFTCEFRVVRDDGQLRWLSHRGQTEYDDVGQPLRNFGIVMDVTERKQVEQVLRDADQQKDEFIATLAHELRNPLAPIRHAIDLMSKLPPGDPRAVRGFGVIDRQVDHMARLLDDLLDVSRMTRNQLQLRRQPLDAVEAITQAIEIAQPLIRAGDHTLVVDLAPEPMPLEGDLMRLAQVFSNVLINAAKYTPAQGRIELRAQRQADSVVVTVADTGIGIAAHNIARIFERFGQVESALSRSQGGQGIGLALAKSLVEMHGGSIGVRSEGPGRGSLFEVSLPLALSAEAENTAADSATNTAETTADQSRAVHASAATAAARRILIADDSRDITDCLALLLSELGHVIEVAHDGEQALQMAEALRPDVMLIDLGMPKLNGYEVCRSIRAQPWGMQMTIIAQTGWGQAEDRRRSREAGFDHHLVKPVDFDDLVAVVER